jgi:hypothetical protein
MPVLIKDNDRFPSLWTDAMSTTLPTIPVVAITTWKTGKTDGRNQVQQFTQNGKNVWDRVHTKFAKTRQKQKRNYRPHTHTHPSKRRHFLDVSVFRPVYIQRTATELQ